MISCSINPSLLAGIVAIGHFWMIPVVLLIFAFGVYSWRGYATDRLKCESMILNCTNLAALMTIVSGILLLLLLFLPPVSR